MLEADREEVYTTKQQRQEQNRRKNFLDATIQRYYYCYQIGASFLFLTLFNIII